MRCSNSPREICSLCGEVYRKREMNKLYYAPSHYSTYNPRLVCHICDNCLPRLAEYLEVNIGAKDYKY